MKVVSIAFGVIIVHLVMLWWIQVDQAIPVSEILPVMVMITPEPAHHPVEPIAPVLQTRQRSPIKAAPGLVQQAPAPADLSRTIAPSNPGHLAQDSWHTSVDLGQANQAVEPGNAQGTAATQVTVGKPGIVHPPSSSADYLDNPPPTYPALSRRLGEQGKVTIRVLISRDGGAKQAEVARSSGFERLDQVALRTALAWRYVPGQQDGKPQEMWFDVPISFKLN